MKIKVLILTAIVVAMAFFTTCKEDDPIETKGGITGRVSEEGSTKPVAAAEVTVSGNSQNYKTGSNGKYEITNLEEGNYTVTANKAGYVTNSKQFTVKAGQITNGDFSLELDVPTLNVNPLKLEFKNEIEQMTFALSNDNSKTDLEWLIEIPKNANWLSVSKESGKLSKGEETITVYVDRSKMTEKKTYSSNLVVKSTNGGGSATIKVIANEVVAILNVEPKDIDFGIDKTNMTFNITNGNSYAAMNWVIEKDAKANWLKLSATEGENLRTGNELITLSVNRNNMPEEKKYTTTLIVKSTNGGGSQFVNVSAEKRTAHLSVEPNALDFGKKQSEKIILVSNYTNKGTIKFNAKSSEKWITINNGSGTINGEETQNITINVSRKGLEVGKYTGEIVISSDANTLTIKVAMEVAEKQAPAIGNLQYSDITKNSVSLTATITSIGSANVTSHGFCWSATTGEPNINDSKKDLGAIDSPQGFSSVITNLTSNTDYHIRAYATNKEGTAYSSAISISTLAEKKINVNGNLNFGNITVNTTSTLNFNIQNPGTIPITINSINCPNGFSGNWAGTIAAGSSQSVAVIFAPTVAKYYSGTLTVNSDATSGNSSISVSGTGAEQESKTISISGNLSFGNVNTGSSISKSFTITNTGNADVSVSSISYPSGYSSSWNSGTIAPGQTINIKVVFSPSVAKSYNGNITINSDANGTNTISVSGMGVTPEPTGTGRATFYMAINGVGWIDVTVNGETFGLIYDWSSGGAPKCGETFKAKTRYLNVGTYSYTAKAKMGMTFSGTFEVVKDGCTLVCIK